MSCLTIPLSSRYSKDIESHKRTLIAHVAEPDEAWLPPDPTGLDYSYYAQNHEMVDMSR
jgi:hypothetical protein